jgi:peroxiredoxin Q/BCP
MKSISQWSTAGGETTPMAARKTAKKPARKPARKAAAKTIKKAVKKTVAKAAKKVAKKVAVKKPMKAAAKKIIKKPAKVVAKKPVAKAKPAAAPKSVNLSAGTAAPDFTLPTDGGGSLTLSELRGRPVILYFYPRDDTPGCTVEACAFRDNLLNFQGVNAAVLGVSTDSVQSHDRFKAKFQLPFPLLADEDHKVAEAYGVWVEKNRYGRKYMGTERSTFLIDADGRIARVWNKVKVEGHAEEVLAAARGG